MHQNASTSRSVLCLCRILTTVMSMLIMLSALPGEGPKISSSSRAKSEFRAQGWRRGCLRRCDWSGVRSPTGRWFLCSKRRPSIKVCSFFCFPIGRCLPARLRHFELSHIGYTYIHVHIFSLSLYIYQSCHILPIRSH